MWKDSYRTPLQASLSPRVNHRGAGDYRSDSEESEEEEEEEESDEEEEVRDCLFFKI